MLRDALGADAKFLPITNDHPIYHCFFDFNDGPPQGSENNQMVSTDTAGLQGYTARGNTMTKPVLYLEGITIDNRLVAIYSDKGYAIKWKDTTNNDPQLKMGVNMIVFALTQAGVDQSRIALIGISMGGLLAPRAAAFEKRLKLLVANPGVYDWSRNYTEFLAAFNPDLATLADRDPEAFNQLIAQVASQSPLIAWGMKDSMWRHGVSTPAALMKEVKRYTNKGVAGKITAKALVIDGEAEEFGQARELYDALKGPKDYMMFTAAEAAELHVQTGSLAVQTRGVFEWLEDNL